MPVLDDADREALRGTLRAFIEREVLPHIEAWEEAGSFPRELYHRAGELGLLGLGFPEDLGGSPGDSTSLIILCEEFARTGSGGLIAGLFSHGIGLPPIVNLGTDAQQRRFVPDVLAGRKIAALAVTEPSGGSDVANLKTTARRDGDSYVVHGSKTFITSGMRADLVTVAVRTGPPGLGGISLLVVEAGTPGFTRTALDKKMGWWCSDTATLYFDDCRVPADNLLGEENGGFLGIMQNFNRERLTLAAMAVAFAQVCLDDAIAYARQRETFGKPLVTRQVIRHKLVDMATRIHPVRTWLYQLAARIDAGEWPIAEICMLKNAATQCVEFCAKEGVQIFGGAGFMRGARVERIYRETRVLAIGGGAEEIMKDLAAKQMGL
ncbi:acyl-CoA dehydrogenase family protein [Nannocystis bainbridge]|uniref:Acyl-CoA dehydrogenase family protein n=1 Tax=Nannocystis bainbridge TaxID=2995303 RepID=A0ABT5DTA8_9BACT|nr:acyl-CoA dehydrogenase family protein [Nannocystis bainbridge]MDC0716876.1 acyl-CoA dehydrogenase family protein [Nannocystis bainbridge]